MCSERCVCVVTEYFTSGQDGATNAKGQTMQKFKYTIPLAVWVSTTPQLEETVLTPSDLQLIADALEVISPDGDEASAARAEQLATLFAVFSIHVASNV